MSFTYHGLVERASQRRNHDTDGGTQRIVAHSRDQHGPRVLRDRSTVGHRKLRRLGRGPQQASRKVGDVSHCLLGLAP